MPLTEEKEKEYREIVLNGAKKIFKANLVEFGEGNVSTRIPFAYLNISGTS